MVDELDESEGELVDASDSLVHVSSIDVVVMEVDLHGHSVTDAAALRERNERRCCVVQSVLIAVSFFCVFVTHAVVLAVVVCVK